MHLGSLHLLTTVAMAIPTGLVVMAGWNIASSGSPPVALPEAAQVETVTVGGKIAYPVPGEFTRDGRPVDAPRQLVELPPFAIMKDLVSAADYAACVDAGACKTGDGDLARAADLPAVGISYLDAQAYAAWSSAASGQDWRLPTEAEWALAAAERFVGEETAADDPSNPARRWLDAYRAEVARKRGKDAGLRPRGGFGANANGINDLAGNVWEWTSTCYLRAALALDGPEVVSSIENCRVHIMAGRHRAYMSDFLRDGKSGGCAVGTPPEHLGFRLVRDERLSFLARLRAAVRELLAG
jgi:formylglycine-generating enzyme required for sulfatase activity